MPESVEKHLSDVVVLGMPGSGKTVFLSVLGQRFTTTALHARRAPLGLRLVPDVDTAAFVQKCQESLAARRWPAGTLVGSLHRLTWEVLTGGKRQFAISSFDYAGEVYRRAFGKPDGRGAPPEDTDAAVLREAADAAKVICLFISLGGEGADGENRMREASDAAYRILKDPALAGKCVVVLTQSHGRREEIARAGGPELFVEKAVGPTFAQCVEGKVPVIDVSAVNETEGAEVCGREVAVPKKGFSSDGLYGFLLVVGGILSEGLRAVGGKYRECLAAGYGYRYATLGMHGCAERLGKAERYRACVEAFRKACEGFLADRGNLRGADGAFDAALSAAYARATFEEEEFQALDRASAQGLGLERAWGRALREAAGRGRPEGPGECRAVVERVRELLGGAGADADIFGFEAAEGGRGEETRLEWVAEQVAATAEAAARAARRQAKAAKRLYLRTALGLLLAATGAWLWRERRDEAVREHRRLLAEASACASTGQYGEALRLAERIRDRPLLRVRRADALPEDFSERCAEAQELEALRPALDGAATNVGARLPFDVSDADAIDAVSALAPGAWAGYTNSLAAARAARLAALPGTAFGSRNFAAERENARRAIALFTQADERLGAAYHEAALRRAGELARTASGLYDTALACPEPDWAAFFDIGARLAATESGDGPGGPPATNAFARLVADKLEATAGAIDAAIEAGQTKTDQERFNGCRAIEQELDKLDGLLALAAPTLPPETAAQARRRLAGLRGRLPAFLVLSVFVTADGQNVYYDTESAGTNQLPCFYAPNRNAPNRLSAVFPIPPSSGVHKFQLRCRGKTFWARGAYQAGTWTGIRYVSVRTVLDD